MTDSEIYKYREDTIKVIENYIDNKIENEKSSLKLLSNENKEELRTDLTDHLDRRFASEKTLIQDYIGLGLKIALGSLTLTVLVFGFFGYKNYSDVSKAIEAEIKERFNKDNPVKSYDAMLKDTAVGAVTSSMRPTSIPANLYRGRDNNMLVYLGRALQDADIKINRKIDILRLAITLDQSDAIRLAKDSQTSVLQSLNVKSEENLNLIMSATQLYASSDPDYFLRTIKQIVEAYKDDPQVLRILAKELPRMSLQQAADVSQSFGKTSDPVISFNIAGIKIRNRTAGESDIQAFETYIGDAFSNRGIFSPDNAINMPDVLNVISSLDPNSDMFWRLCAKIAEIGTSKGYRVIFRTNDGFGDVTPTVSFATSGFSQGLNLRDYRIFLGRIAKHFLKSTNYLSHISDKDFATMEFFSMKQSNGAGGEIADLDYEEAQNYFEYRNKNELKDDVGKAVADGRLQGRLIIKLSSAPADGHLMLIWKNDLNEMLRSRAKSLTGIERESIKFREYGRSLDPDE